MKRTIVMIVLAALMVLPGCSQTKSPSFDEVLTSWRPNHPIDARYIWLPIEFENGKPVVRWRDEWDTNIYCR